MMIVTESFVHRMHRTKQVSQGGKAMSKEKLFLKELWLKYTPKTETSHTNHDETYAVNLRRHFHVLYSDSHFEL